MNSHCVYWAVIYFIINKQHTTGKAFNISHTDLQYCKEYDVSDGKYSDSIQIDTFKMAFNVADPEETILNLRFYLLASKDAHILLSPKNQIDNISTIYEIVLSAQGKTAIMARSNSNGNSVKSNAAEKFILSTEITPLTLRITKSGNISVAITGQSSFISYFDKDLLPIKYISFSPNVKWFYDCENPADEEDKLEPINQNLERLQNDLFEQYDATVAPNDLSIFTVELTRTNFIADKSFMTAHAQFRTVWIDKKLVWDPSEYGDTYKFMLKNTSNEQIWTPKISLSNSMDGELISLPLMYTVTVTANGTIFAESNDSLVSTVCQNKNWNWPVDIVKCDIQLQLDEVAVNKLTPLKNGFANSNLRAFNDIHSWRVNHANISFKVKTLRAVNDGNDQILLKNLTLLELDVTFQQNNSLFSQLFSVPAIGNCIAIVLALISFRRRHTSALILNISSLIMLFVMLMMFSVHGPTNYTSTVVICYTHSLFLAWSVVLVAAIRCIGKERKLYV